MIGWVFPGQGSLHVGMGAGLESREARDTLTEASEVLGWDVLRVCRDGPAERLDSTEITQPAVVATSVAAARTLESLGLRPDAVAGHSVGEFAALVVAGAMRFEDAMRAVAVRGEAMLRAGRAHTGGMAAVLGLPAGRVGVRRAGAGLCVEAGPGEVLSGLVRRIAPDAETAHVGEDAEARELADRLVLVDGGRPGGSDR